LGVIFTSFVKLINQKQYHLAFCNVGNGVPRMTPLGWLRCGNCVPQQWGTKEVCWIKRFRRLRRGHSTEDLYFCNSGQATGGFASNHDVCLPSGLWKSGWAGARSYT